ncbi:type III PLP-dependent enzyme [Bailinhaonella thermotolerans]|uniref:Type III PLP-dependent enzyme n=1 Tax=Bailinhaonella thermotolerans TaxID=1070861 RepID=A0A3A4AXX8_9ACTN|nr:type III PLP-dependent enzyme [Bailinhaonella thermotolerans]RJL33269.1 type III PLP-dependent enzyme [Bailinhaonella thermotolerans]
MTPHADLAERYGTPLYVYDLDEVAAAKADLAGFLPDGCRILYSLKANPHPDVARALREGPGPGCGAEVSSVGELAAAAEAGFTGAEIVYTGPGKTPGELAHAVARGVRSFSAESPEDLRNIGRAAEAHGVVAGCLLRVNSAEPGSGTGLRMTGKPTQFGIDAETVAASAAELRAAPGTSITGVHLFSQSNAPGEDSLIAELRHSVEVAARIQDDLGPPLRTLDIGGGFASPYGRPGPRPAYPRLRAALESALDAAFPGWRRGEPGVAVESGRYLTGSAGTLLTRVTSVKTGRGRTHVILDAGINVFGGLSGLGRLLPVSVEPEPGGAHARATLAGPLCTPADILARDVPVADLGPGDVLAIPNTGAYGLTASLTLFLGRPAPVEAVVRGGQVVSATRIVPTRVPVAG